MLVAKSDERQDGNPYAVDFGDIFLGCGGQEESESDEPVTSNSSEKVAAPVTGKSDTTFGPGNCVGFLGVAA